MRSHLAVLLAVLCVGASGQQRASFTGGGSGFGGFPHGVASPLINPFVHPFITSDLTFAQRLGATVSGSYAGLPAFSQGLFPGWSFIPRLGSPGFSWASGWGWNGASAVMGSGFSPVPYPVFMGGPYGPDYPPQQVSPVMTVLPPKFIAEPAPPVRIIEPGPGIRSFQAPVDGRETVGWESGRDSHDNTPRTPAVHVYPIPAREPTTAYDHPPLIALKNGWAYTVTKYWTKGKTFHFVTTQGDHIQVPLTQLDRLYMR